MANLAAAIAANRFGLGARPGDLDWIQAQGPQAWLARQLEGEPQTVGLRRLPGSVLRLAELQQPPPAGAGDPVAERQHDEAARAVYLVEAGRRALVRVASEQPFAERLVAFWGNHFAVSVVEAPRLRLLAGAFEREAIRAHLFGSFGAMLSAVIRHPAMLLYLDNTDSVGPESPAGDRRRGGNENLARELLELHTLGVDGGYDQTDVQELALILTGWTVAEGAERGDGRGFRFAAEQHAPGRRRLLGRSYAEAGVEQGERALADLAQHPATARHIATKLARHLIADDPPAAAVARLERRFLETGGDLRALALALIEEPLAWQAELAKLKRPDDLVVSSARATDFHRGNARPLLAALDRLGELPFGARSAAGYSDLARDWGGAGAVLARIDWCAEVAGRSRDEAQADPAGLARALLADSLSAATAGWLTRAPSRREALALLLASPEFQRR